MNKFTTTDLTICIDPSFANIKKNSNILHTTEMAGGPCPSPSKDKAWEQKMRNAASIEGSESLAGRGNQAALANLKNAISALQQQMASC